MTLRSLRHGFYAIVIILWVLYAAWTYLRLRSPMHALAALKVNFEEPYTAEWTKLNDSIEFAKVLRSRIPLFNSRLGLEAQVDEHSVALADRAIRDFLENVKQINIYAFDVSGESTIGDRQVWGFTTPGTDDIYIHSAVLNSGSRVLKFLVVFSEWQHTKSANRRPFDCPEIQNELDAVRTLLTTSEQGQPFVSWVHHGGQHTGGIFHDEVCRLELFRAGCLIMFMAFAWLGFARSWTSRGSKVVAIACATLFAVIVVAVLHCLLTDPSLVGDERLSTLYADVVQGAICFSIAAIVETILATILMDKLWFGVVDRWIAVRQAVSGRAPYRRSGQ